MVWGFGVRVGTVRVWQDGMGWEFGWGQGGPGRMVWWLGVRVSTLRALLEGVEVGS